MRLPPIFAALLRLMRVRTLPTVPWLPVGLLVLMPTSALLAQVPERNLLRLGPGDRVRVEVAGDSTLSGDFDIDSEGRVLVPIVGLATAAGRPFGEVAREIVDGFNRELVGPLVRVIPLLRVSVLGEVQTPGLYWVDPTMTLAEVLAASGGLTDSARQEDVRIRRGAELIVLSANAQILPSLRSGDRIVVGRRGFVSDNGPLLIGAAASVLAAVLTSLILR